MHRTRFSGIAPRLTALAAAGLLLSSWPVAAQAPSASEPDGLVRVHSERFDAAYLAPGTDFSVYTKVMLDPTEAGFKRNWQRDYNSTMRGSDARMSDDEARSILQSAQTAFNETLTEAYRDAGIEVVTTPAPDVLRIRTGIANINVTAPDQMTAGRSYTFSSEAGEATLVLEARDSMTGALLGRAYDRRSIGDTSFNMRRTSVSNSADFRRAFRQWSQRSVEAFNALRSTPATAVSAAGGP